MTLIRSKQRITDHGEVFTPEWMARAMLELVEDECKCIESRFLEPSCGHGIFLAEILIRKLGTVRRKYRNRLYDARQNALLALMSTYGIELLGDNVAECRAVMLNTFAQAMNVGRLDELFRAASYVLSQNIVHGDALRMRTHTDRPILFAEWSYVGKGKFQRRDFRLDALQQKAGSATIIAPVRVYPLMAISNLAAEGTSSVTRKVV